MPIPRNLSALILAAAFCQARLICNLLDGMVAVEGGKREPSGPFWNEFPDRVADILILAGAGLGLGNPALGFAAAAFAMSAAVAVVVDTARRITMAVADAFTVAFGMFKRNDPHFPERSPQVLESIGFVQAKAFLLRLAQRHQFAQRFYAGVGGFPAPGAHQRAGAVFAYLEICCAGWCAS